MSNPLLCGLVVPFRFAKFKNDPDANGGYCYRYPDLDRSGP
ncbi:MAG: hypothetical protein ACO1N1_01230 [Dyadobacter fermentans]